ncbi:MAG: hypothetical protein V1798_09890, partial [Pseudomonadota bacterium]
MRGLSAEDLRAEINEAGLSKDGKLKLGSRSRRLAQRVLRFQEKEGLTCRQAGERLGLGVGQVQYLRTLARGRRKQEGKPV